MFFVTMDNNTIPEMNLENKYSTPPAIQQNPEEAKKEMEKTKKEVEKIKNSIIKKFPYVQAISILPPQAISRSDRLYNPRYVYPTDW